MGPGWARGSSTCVPRLRLHAETWGLCPGRCSGDPAVSCQAPGSGVCRKDRKKGTSQVTRNNVLLPQSVLGALIAVNLKNSLKQLADPYYLWRRSKLDCVGIGRLPAVPLPSSCPSPCQLSSPPALWVAAP